MKTNDYKWKRLYEECGYSSSPSSSSSTGDYSKYMSKSDKITVIRMKSKMSSDEAEEFLEEHDWDLEEAIKSLKEKKKKPIDKKVFKIGDKIICIDTKPGKNMSPDCMDFLLTYKYFIVKDVNDKLNIDLGHKLAENGNPYYFSPNRFELKDGKAPIKKADTGEIVDADSIEKKDEKDEEKKKKPSVDWYKKYKETDMTTKGTSIDTGGSMGGGIDWGNPWGKPWENG